ANSFSVIEVVTMVKELGYVNQGMQFDYRILDSNLDNALKPLSSDYYVTDMAKYVSKSSGSNVSKTNCTRKDKASGPNDSKKPIVIEENDRSHSSVASDDSEENDLDVDQEDTIDDVEVDMADFR
ncbi:hypothetical protein Tco_0306641, partial [Tanacetum coccineum]